MALAMERKKPDHFSFLVGESAFRRDGNEFLELLDGQGFAFMSGSGFNHISVPVGLLPGKWIILQERFVIISGKVVSDFHGSHVHCYRGFTAWLFLAQERFLEVLSTFVADLSLCPFRNVLNAL